MDQPKDYAVLEKTYDHIIEEELKSCSLYVKTMYKFQKYMILTIASSIGLGYLIGVYLGKFW